MVDVHFDPASDDQERRRLLHAGGLIVLSPTDAGLELRRLLRATLDKSFAPHDPQTAQFSVPLLEFSKRMQQATAEMSSAAETRLCIGRLLREHGCDPVGTYFHRPFLRSATSTGYMTSAGRPYMFAPHRDAWAAAPACQVTWWMPIYDLDLSGSLAFYPDYWDRPVRNGSEDFDYQESVAPATAASVAADVAAGKRRTYFAEEPVDARGELRLICAAGGLILFSSGHLHATAENQSGRTRFSVDFRTVHIDDLRENRGPAIVDAAGKGTSLTGFRQADGFGPLPAELIERYRRNREVGGRL